MPVQQHYIHCEISNRTGSHETSENVAVQCKALVLIKVSHALQYMWLKLSPRYRWTVCTFFCTVCLFITQMAQERMKCVCFDLCWPGHVYKAFCLFCVITFIIKALYRALTFMSVHKLWHVTHSCWTAFFLIYFINTPVFTLVWAEH